MISCFMQLLRSEAAEHCGEVSPAGRLDSESCGNDNNSQLCGENIGVVACAMVAASLNCNYRIARDGRG